LRVLSLPDPSNQGDPAGLGTLSHPGVALFHGEPAGLARVSWHGDPGGGESCWSARRLHPQLRTVFLWRPLQGSRESSLSPAATGCR
jgi:hypothetical protein